MSQQRYSVLVAIIFVLFMLASCANAPREVVEHDGGHSNHAHLDANSRNAGDFHIKNFMNRRTGVIGIQVMDQWEEPLYIMASSIRALIERKGVAAIEGDLTGEGWGPRLDGLEDYGRQEGATVFTMRAPWLKTEHEVRLSVWVPLPDGKTHHLSFDCVARDEAPAHSGLK